MIYRFLRSPNFAYTRPIDNALRELQSINAAKINSYSFAPPLAIRIKSERIEDDDTAGTRRGRLRDSAIERVRMYERIMEDGGEIPNIRDVFEIG